MTFCVYGGMLRCVGKREPSKQKRADTQNSQVRAQNNGMRLPCQSMGSRAKTCVGLRPSWAQKQKTKKSGEQERVASARRGAVEVGNSQSQEDFWGRGRFHP